MGRLATIADYMVAFVSEFAKNHNLNPQQAFRYLWNYGAIKDISACYDAAHTLSFEDVCNTATKICRSRGGRL